jgi:hypothetical protein
MSRISVKAVIIGGIVDIVATNIATIPRDRRSRVAALRWKGTAAERLRAAIRGVTLWRSQ